ncbi:hypothetical protein C8R45DRAFT_1185850 [Mycena sanguinolenta]|nr:hypothetical protein C8R45DRAFT_1185850 [Mycena sanguinolenta]
MESPPVTSASSSPSPPNPSPSPAPLNSPSSNVGQSAHPTVTTPIIPPLFVDNLAKQYGLAERDLMKLRGLVQVGGSSSSLLLFIEITLEVVTMTGNSLSQSDLASRLYMTAIILSEAAERRRMEQANTFTGDVHAMMRDIKIRLDESFDLTKQLKACLYFSPRLTMHNIRGVTQDMIHDSGRTVFFTMHVDVLPTLKSQQEKLRLDNIFGVPAREKKLVSALKRICSSVRNAFRQDIRDSIDPNKFITLEDCTLALATKYKLGGAGELSDMFKIHAALLRRFAFDHPALLGVGEVVEDDDRDDDAASSPPKKRKRTQGGRVAKGQDFWSQVDAYFKEEVTRRGRNFKDLKWKTYVEQIIVDDNSKFFGLVPGMTVGAVAQDSTVLGPSTNTGGLPNNFEGMLQFDGGLSGGFAGLNNSQWGSFGTLMSTGQ